MRYSNANNAEARQVKRAPFRIPHPHGCTWLDERHACFLHCMLFLFKQKHIHMSFIRTEMVSHRVQFSCTVSFLSTNPTWPSFLLVHIHLPTPKAACWKLSTSLPEPAFSGDTLVHTQGKQQCWSDDPHQKKWPSTLRKRNFVDKTLPPPQTRPATHCRLSSEKTLGMANIFSKGPSALNLRARNGDILDNAPYLPPPFPITLLYLPLVFPGVTSQINLYSNPYVVGCFWGNLDSDSPRTWVG